MKVRVIKSGQLLTLENARGLRLIEQGLAVPVKDAPRPAPRKEPEAPEQAPEAKDEAPKGKNPGKPIKRP